MPSGLGTEGAGVVDAGGAGVTHLKEGDRVAYAQGPLGAYAEYHVLPADKVVVLPKDIDFETAAASMLKGLTVQYLVRQTRSEERRVGKEGGRSGWSYHEYTR